MKHTYTGDERQEYPQYLDAEHGRTLVAEPGEAYEIVPVDGHTAPGPLDDEGQPSEAVPISLPVPPADGRWKATRTPTEKKED